MKTEKTKIRLNKYFMVLSLSFIVFLIIAALYNGFPQFRAFETASLDFRYKLKTFFEKDLLKIRKNSIYNRIAIAAIDDNSILDNGGWPFDRKVWADTLNTLSDSPNVPDLTFFDIVFTDPSRNPESDKAMKEAFKNFKGTLGEDIILDIIPGINVTELNKGSEESLETMTNFIISHCLDYNSPRIRALRRFEINYTNQIAITPYPIVSPLLEELPGYLGFIGAANIESREKSSRADPSIPFILPAIFKVKDNNGNYSVTNIYYPSIVLAIVIKELHADISDVLAGNHELIIKNALYNGRRIDFKIPVDENYNMNINYKSGPGTSYIKIIPFEKIATTTLPPDCILFVGMYSRKGSRDLYQSPFGEMYGVEHLCYAIGTILSRDFLYEVPDWVNLAFILLLTLSVGLLTARGLRITIGAGAPLAILLPVAAGSVLFQFNIIIATLIPIMSGILAILSVQIYMLFTEEKEKSFIKTTFSSYLNPKLVDILIQNPERIQLGGEDKEVTVLFSAIKNLHDLTGGMGAKDLIGFLNEYFSMMTDIVMETSGTLDKYIGDSVMAFWGAPVDNPGHAFNACNAGLKMLEKVHIFNKGRQEKGLDPIILYIGINTGIIIVGNVGSESQKNYTAIGDSVNLASRLKGLNKFYHTQAVISEFTYDKIKDRVVARELDLTRVKGKLKPVRIYELLDFTE